MNSSSSTTWLRTAFERFARGPAGGFDDDGAEVSLLDQRVDVDAPEDGIQVDPVQQRIQIDLVQQRIHIQRGNHKVDCTLRDSLCQRLAARDESAFRRAPLPKRIHEISMAALSGPGPTR